VKIGFRGSARRRRTRKRVITGALPERSSKAEMIARWMDRAAQSAAAIFKKHAVQLTLGGEPTFVPIHPEGAEWNYAAVGPTKLGYAWKVAENLLENRMLDSAAFFCPGKLYPGEINPRWVLRILANRDGTPLFRLPSPTQSPKDGAVRLLADGIRSCLGVRSHWLPFLDRSNPNSEILAMPLDYDDGSWRSWRWSLIKDARVLSGAEGPAGLRLPLDRLPSTVPRRAVSIEKNGDAIAIFIPPLLQKPFLELLSAIQQAAMSNKISGLALQGYVPADESGSWIMLGLSADPGVLEVNLPACRSWHEYATWIEAVTVSCNAAGLRPWKEPAGDYAIGSGGGNHLLWGGPTLEANPFFSRPGWLATILRFWQHHPSLAYLFTGSYVGASSQAPRPDESARDLDDIEMAYSFLSALPPGDHRELINETLRHLQTDISGNTHRSEISFDKFWNTSWPAGALGLMEFRAIESLPRADWMSSVALLWNCMAAYLLEIKGPPSLKHFGTKLHDEYLLPERLWSDLKAILNDLEKHGFKLHQRIYRDIWNWRFPILLSWKKDGVRLVVRRALENWPLLCETPIEGGTTSRFVDTSLQRLEFCADSAFEARYRIYVSNRLLALQKVSPDTFLRGLRYRRTKLYPSMHPGIPTQLPLSITIVDRESGRAAARFEMRPSEIAFHSVPGRETPTATGRPCHGGRKGDLTCDLRLE
jgi:uncharacterized protein (DUF2126 family)